ncbi:MAG: hypothetical protein AB7K68_05960 [Bacteriovoracia bacterium]
MNFGNIVVPLLIFCAPLAALVLFALKSDRRSDSEKRGGLILFGTMLLASLIGIFQFELPVKMEFLLPLSTDTSGYFEPSLLMYWVRYVWIFLSASVLLGLVMFDGASSFGGARGTLRFLFLSGSFLFLALAYLSENALLSLMFIEITVFLLHSFSLEMGGTEGELERISYFKRNSFLFLGLIAMLGLTAASFFTNSSVVLLGMVLYVMAFMLSKHNFSEWRYVPLALIQAGTAFFLLGRVIHEDMSGELWIPLSALFAVATALFSALSFLASTTLSASFWMLFGIFGYILFLRFSSLKPEELSWGAFEAMGLLSCYALSLLLRFARQSAQAWRTALIFLATLFLLGIISGVVPFTSVPSAHTENRETILKIAIMGILTFLLSLVAVKALVGSLRQNKEKENNFTFASAVLPASLVILIQLAALFRAYDGLSGLLQFPIDFLSDISLVVRGAALLVGGLAGMLLGANSRLSIWSANKEKKMEDLFPRIDPAVVRWNQAAVLAPEKGMDWIALRAGTINIRAASALQETDRMLFAEKFPGGFLAYGSSLSRLMRFLHSGNIRFYLFFGTVLTLFAGVLFLLGAK